MFKKAGPNEYRWMTNKEGTFKHSCVVLSKGLEIMKYSVTLHEFGHAIFNLADQYDSGREKNANTSKGTGAKSSRMNRHFFLTCDDADGLVYSIYKRKYGKEPDFPSFCDYDTKTHPDFITKQEINNRFSLFQY